MMPTPGDQHRMLAGPVAGTLIGFIGIYTVPYLVGMAVETFGWPAEQAGWLAFSVIAAAATGSALSPVLGRRGGLRRATLAAGAVAAVGQAMCMAGPPAPAFMLLQVLANLAGGLVAGITTASLAGSPQVDQHYGRMFAATSLLFGGLLCLVPEAQQLWGPRCLFGLIAMAQCVSLGGLWVWRAAPRPLTMSGAASRAPRRQVALLMASMTLGFATYGAVYSFSERIAALLGMGPAATGAALGLSTAAAVVGAALAGRWGARAGRTLPLCGSLLVLGLADLGILAAWRPALLIAGLLLYGLVSMVFTTYTYATAAALDPSGRLVSRLQGFTLLPYALGPGLLGLLVAGPAPSYPAAGWAALGVNIAAALLVAPVVWTLDREGRVDPSP